MRAERGGPAWGGAAIPNDAGGDGAPDLVTAQTLEALEDQAKSIGQVLDNVNRRIEELKSRSNAEEQTR
jgi:hypothetical protein